MSQTPRTAAGRAWLGHSCDDGEVEQLNHILAIESEAAVSSLDVERLARALAVTEVGCWANPTLHGPEQDDEVHLRDAQAIAKAYAEERP